MNILKNINLAVEQAILGVCLLYEDKWSDISNEVEPIMFGNEENKQVAKYIWETYLNNEKVSVAKVRDFIGENDLLVNATNLIQLADVSAFNSHCKTLKDNYLRRELASIFIDAQDKVHAKEDAAKVFFEAAQMWETLQSGGTKLDRNETIDAAHAAIVAASQSKGMTGASTGYHSINQLTGGWQRTDQVVIAGRPAMGKTTWVLNTLLSAACCGVPVAFISLEMSKAQIYQKIFGMIAGVSTEKMRQGKVTVTERKNLEVVKGIVKDLPFYVEGGCNDFAKLKSVVRRLKRKYDIQICAADYLQLCSYGAFAKSNRNNEISAITRESKQLASEEDCNITFIWLSQLSRAVEMRGGAKRPMMSDLRDSGSIEQDADIIGFMYRAEYYDILEDAEGNSLKGIAELIISKNRHGRLANLNFNAHLDVGVFEENFNGQDIDFMPSKMYRNKLEFDLQTEQDKVKEQNNYEKLDTFIPQPSAIGANKVDVVNEDLPF